MRFLSDAEPSIFWTQVWRIARAQTTRGKLKWAETIGRWVRTSTCSDVVIGLFTYCSCVSYAEWDVLALISWKSSFLNLYQVSLGKWHHAFPSELVRPTRPVHEDQKRPASLRLKMARNPCMAYCSKCRKWFHKSCQLIPDHADVIFSSGYKKNCVCSHRSYLATSSDCVYIYLILSNNILLVTLWKSASMDIYRSTVV